MKKRFFIKRSEVNKHYFVVWDYQNKREVSRMYHPSSGAPDQIKRMMNEGSHVYASLY